MTRQLLDLNEWPNRISRRITDRMMRYFPQRVLDIRLAQPVVSFSFDDVPHSAVRAGATILERYNARGTFYIAGGLQDKMQGDTRMFSSADVQYLARAGHEVACHSYSHRKVSAFTHGNLERDLARNKAYLDSLTPQQGVSRNFAYPYNASKWCARQLFAARFNSCRGGGNQINRGRINRDLLYGVEIGGDQNTFSTLSAYIEDVVQKPGWLIFFTHDVDDNPSPYGCSRALFESLLAFAVENSCCILPVKDALSLLQGQNRE
ncbi:polysaccharide deacetylase family protein [Paenochrobactrum sp. BZR 588]|uniref:polysaccharide deacetylase family protein n=1 Tax=unclassified Paenochrobactrum TaxID=2639760 RepID=UPI0038524F39